MIGKDDLLQKHKEYFLFKDGDWSSLDDLGHYEGAGFNDDSELVVYDDNILMLLLDEKDRKLSYDCA